MRRILITHARRKKSAKRGGGYRRIDLDPDHVSFDAPPERLLALDEALQRFTRLDPVKGELVKLRFFAGLTIEQVAAALNISSATTERYWTYSRAWLQRELSDPDDVQSD